jgi:hypothetical protein
MAQMLCVLVALVLSQVLCSSSFADIEPRHFMKPALRGLSGVHITVVVDTELGKAGLSWSTILNDAEEQLRNAGIRVAKMSDNPSAKELGIRIRADKLSTAPVWSVLTTVALFQGVSLERDSKIRLMGAETWTVDVLRTLHQDDLDSIRSDVRAQLSLFVDDYQEMNGKRKQ